MATLSKTDSTAKVAASMNAAAKRTSTTDSLSFREIQMITPSKLLSSFPQLARIALAALGAAIFAVSAPAAAQTSDTIGEGDTVRVTVFQNPDLSVESRVAADGSIPYPLLGQVKLGGLSTAAASGRISDQLKRGGYLKNPQVTVAVTAMRSRQVSVLGHVARPGRYALDESSSRLTDVLALAGGIAPTGDDIVQVMVNRGGKIAKMSVDVPVMFRSGDLSKNIEVHSGDTIFVSRAPVFYIYGEVTHAGSYRLEQNMSVMQALSVGGGLSPRGTDRGLKINRLMPDGAVRTIDAKLTDLVQVDDVIYVKESIF
jgi:polysaccharide biosynthesis/export protein